MAEIKSYKDLDVWKLSIEQCVLLYELTRSFPKDELYGIISQIRRAAVSIPSNISEGYSRRSSKEKAHFINIAIASNSEVETHIIISQKLNYIKDPDKINNIMELNDHIGRAMTKLYMALTK